MTRSSRTNMGIRRVDSVSKEVEARYVTDVLLVTGVDGFVTALNCTDGGSYGVMWVKRIGNTPLVHLAGAVTEASPGRRGSPRASTERFFPGADGSVFLAQANAGDHDGDSDAPRPTFSRLPYLPHDVVRSGEPARILEGAVFRSDFITSTTTLDLATGAVLSSTDSSVHPASSVPFSGGGRYPTRHGPSVLFSRVDKTVHVSGSHSSADNWNLTLASIELPGIIPGTIAPRRRPGQEPSGFLDAPSGAFRDLQPKELQLFATLQGELMGRFGDSGPANFSRHFHAPIHSVYRVRDAAPGLDSDPSQLRVEKVPFSLEWPQATKLSLERQSQGEGVAFIATLEDGSSIAYPDRLWPAGMSQLAIAAALAGEDSLDASGSNSDGSSLRIVDSPTGHAVVPHDLCDSEESQRLWDAGGQRDRALCRRVTATSHTQLAPPQPEPVAASFSAAEAFLRPGIDSRGPDSHASAPSDPGGGEAALPNGFVLYQVQALNRPWMEALRARLPEPVMTTDAAGVLFIASGSALASMASQSWPVPHGGVNRGTLGSMDPYLDAGLSELSRVMDALPMAGGRLAIEAPPVGPVASGGSRTAGNGSLQPPFGKDASRRVPPLDTDAVSIQLGRFASLDGGAAILFLMSMLLLGATVLAFLASRLRGDQAPPPGDLASPSLSPAPSAGDYPLSPRGSLPAYAGHSADQGAGWGIGPPAIRVVDGQDFEEVTPELLVSKTCLGKGSQGTYVFDGVFKGRRVAVKRMVQESFEARAQNEVKLLIGSNHLPNVVQYYDCVTRSSFIYLVLERCDLSLGTAVMKTFRARKARAAELEKLRLASSRGGSAGRRPHSAGLTAVPLVSPATRAFLRQIVDGLAQLHGAKIVHRDVKPHNILLIRRAAPQPRPSRRFDKDAFDSSSAAVAGQSPPLTPQTSRRGGPDLSPAASAESFTVRDPYASECADFGEWVPKISDMGLGKLLADGASSFGDVSTRLRRGRAAAARAHGDEDSSSSLELAVGAAGRASSGPGVPGTEGWQAPEAVESNRRLLEQLRSHHPTSALSAQATAAAEGSGEDAAAADGHAEGPRHTRSMDVWSLGCVLYFVIDAGNHPFGYGFDQKELIVQGHPDLSRIATSMPEACDLLESMLARDPELRPHALEVLSHPFFWSDSDRIAFFRELSDRIQRESDESMVFRALKVLSPDVFGPKGWCSKLPGAFVDGDDSSTRRYDPQSLRDCFRLVRNRASHFLELPGSVRKHIPGTDASSLVPFLANRVRLPGLFLAGVHIAMTFFADEEAFARFGLKAWADTPPGRTSVESLLDRIGKYAPVIAAEAGSAWTLVGHKPAPALSRSGTDAASSSNSSEAAAASSDLEASASAALVAAGTTTTSDVTSHASPASAAAAAAAAVAVAVDPTPLALRAEVLAAQHRAVDREAACAGLMTPGPWLRACAESAERAGASVRTVKTKTGARKPVVCAHTFPRATTYGGGANTANVAYKLKRCRDWDVAEGRCSRGERCDFLHSPLEACLSVTATNPMANWLQPPTGFKLGGSGKRSKRKPKPGAAVFEAEAGASAPS